MTNDASGATETGFRPAKRSWWPGVVLALIGVLLACSLAPVRRSMALRILRSGPSGLWSWAALEIGDSFGALPPEAIELLRERCADPGLAVVLGPGLLSSGGPSESESLLRASLKGSAEQGAALRGLVARSDCAEFVARLLSDPDASCARAAALCLIEMKAAAEAARAGLHQALGSEDRALCRLAAQALSQLPKAELSIPSLLRARARVGPEGAERDDATREAYDNALRALILSPGYLEGQQELSAPEAELVLPQIRAALSDERDEAQVYALSQLAKMGYAARAEVKKILALALRHREAALLALERVANPPEVEDRAAILELALESLKSSAALSERRTALRILAISGLEDPPLRSVSALLGAFDESDEGLRHEAMASLASLGGVALHEALKSFDSATPERRERLAAALALMGAEAVSELSAGLRSSSEARRFGAAMALGLMEGAGLDALIQALDDETLGTRDAAVTGLILSGGEATGRLVSCLRSEGQGRRIWALFVLGRLGDEARAAVAAILELLDSSTPMPVLAAALDALESFSPKAVSPSDAGVRLIPLLDSKDPTIRARALSRVLGLAPKADGLDAAIDRLCSDPVEFVAREAKAAREKRAKDR